MLLQSGKHKSQLLTFNIIYDKNISTFSVCNRKSLQKELNQAENKKMLILEKAISRFRTIKCGANL